MTGSYACLYCISPYGLHLCYLHMCSLMLSSLLVTFCAFGAQLYIQQQHLPAKDFRTAPPARFLKLSMSCNSLTNSHVLHCGHRVFAERGKSPSTLASSRSPKNAVTVCATNCKLRGKRHLFLCTMCLLELAATSENEVYDEVLQFRVSETVQKLLATPLGRALRASVPDLKSCSRAKTVGATGFVTQLVRPLSIATVIGAVEKLVNTTKTDTSG